MKQKDDLAEFKAEKEFYSILCIQKGGRLITNGKAFQNGLSSEHFESANLVPHWSFYSARLGKSHSTRNHFHCFELWLRKTILATLQDLKMQHYTMYSIHETLSLSFNCAYLSVTIRNGVYWMNPPLKSQSQLEEFKLKYFRLSLPVGDFKTLLLSARPLDRGKARRALYPSKFDNQTGCEVRSANRLKSTGNNKNSLNVSFNFK